MRMLTLAIGSVIGIASGQTPVKDGPAPVAAADLAKIGIELVVPGKPVALADVNGEGFKFLIKVINGTGVEVILWPFQKVELTGPDGRAVKRSKNLGRFGRRKAGCFLEAVPFTKLGAGKSLETTSTLAKFDHDPSALTGWKIDAPGVYTLTLDWTFERAAFVARCKRDCDGVSHADATKPWNRAPELTRKLTAKFEVVP